MFLQLLYVFRTFPETLNGFFLIYSCQQFCWGGLQISCGHAGSLSQSATFLKCKPHHVSIQNSPKIPFTFITKSKFLFLKLYKVLHNPTVICHWFSSFTTFYLLYSLCFNLCPSIGDPPQGPSIFCPLWKALFPGFSMAFFLISFRSLFTYHFKTSSETVPALHSLSTYPTLIFFTAPTFT